MPADWHLPFPAAGKVSKRAVAASAASEVTAGSWPLQPAPADANKKQNGDLVVWLKKRT